MTRKSLIVGAAALAGMLGLAAAVDWSWMPRAQAQGSAAVTPRPQVPAEARSLSRAFVAVAKAVQPSVVRLDIEGKQPERVTRAPRGQRPSPGDAPPDMEKFFEWFFREHGGRDFPTPPARGTGSGIIIDAQGNIVTNNHVIENAQKVKVTLHDGRELSAKVVGRDEHTDVAVVRIENPPPGLVAARVGDSDRIDVGEWVMAIGSPLGLDQSVTAGIISSKGKVGRNVRIPSGGLVRDYIQTDAKINPGNSGGPLVNLDGEVIGVNTMINTGPGGAYGFAIPINQAQAVARSLVKDGRVRYAYLGVLIGDVRDGKRLNEAGEPAEAGAGDAKLPPRAAWVRELVADSPAARAGVHVGDVITRIDDQRIESAQDVVSYVASREVGSKVQLSYLRDGRDGRAQVVLGERPPRNLVAENTDGDVRQEKVGVSLQTLTPEMAGGLGLPAATKGAVITDVVAGSRAARAGLRAEDVILEIDRKRVASAEEAAVALREPSKRGKLLRVRRGAATRFVTLPPE